MTRRYPTFRMIQLPGEMTACLCVLIGSGVVAAEAPPVLVPPALFPPAIVAEETTGDRILSVESAPTATLVVPPAYGPRPPDPAAELQELKRLRFEQLKQQLEELGRRRVAPAPDVKPQSSPTAEPPPERLNPAQIADIPIAPSDSTVDAEMIAAAETETPPPAESAVTNPAESGSSVVEGAIDRLALANSLFGAGEYELALRALKEIPAKSLAREDKIWAEYLQACCRRKQGQVAEAQKIYRRLLAEPDVGWVGELSRWWLDHLDARARLAADSQNLSETLTAWEQEIAKYESSTP